MNALGQSQWSSIGPFPVALIVSVIQTNPSVFFDVVTEEFLFKLKERKPFLDFYAYCVCNLQGLI